MLITLKIEFHSTQSRPCNNVFIHATKCLYKKWIQYSPVFFFFANQHFFIIENKTKTSLFYWSSIFSNKIINSLQKLISIWKHLIIITWIFFLFLLSTKNSWAVLFTEIGKKIDEPLSWAMTINMQLFKTNSAHFTTFHFFPSYNIIERTLTQTQMLYTWKNTVPEQHTTWRVICFIPMPCTVQHIVHMLDRSF